MINNIKLSPSLMCINWLDVRKDLKWIKESEVFDTLHIDIVDGKFAPDFTMGTSIVDLVRSHIDIPFDFHFMCQL